MKSLKKVLESSIYFFCFLTIIQVSAQSNPVNLKKNPELNVDTTTILALIKQGNDSSNNNPSFAYEKLNLALKYSENNQFYLGEAIASTKLAKLYFGSNINKSLEFYNRSLRIYEKYKIGGFDNLAETMLYIAEAYDESGRQDSNAHDFYNLDR